MCDLLSKGQITYRLVNEKTSKKDTVPTYKRIVNQKQMRPTSSEKKNFYPIIGVLGFPLFNLIKISTANKLAMFLFVESVLEWTLNA